MVISKDVAVGLLGRRIPDDEWRAALANASERIDELCIVLDEAGTAVGLDPVSGWRSVDQALASLTLHEQTFKQLKAMHDRAGKPECKDPLVIGARQFLGSFFSFGSMALYWGKLHYRDASGAPGHRALYETGIAKQAAVKRVANNGRQFALNAIKAADAGRKASDLIRQKSYHAPGPPLMELLFLSVPDDVRSQLRLDKLQLSQVAGLGAWLFSRAAILGMIVARDPSPFISMVWDPEKEDKFREHVQDLVAEYESDGNQRSSLRPSKSPRWSSSVE